VTSVAANKAANQPAEPKTVGVIATSQSTVSVTSRTSVEVSRAVARVSDLGAAQNLVVMADQIFATSRHLSGVGSVHTALKQKWPSKAYAC